MSKSKITRTTPAGKTLFAALTVPAPKFNKYQLTLICEDSPELQSLIQEISELTELEVQEAKSAAKNKAAANEIEASKKKPIVEEYNEAGELTGKYLIKMSQRAELTYKGETKKVDAPALFDVKGQQIPANIRENLRVGNFSTAKANIELSPYYMSSSASCGVTLRLQAVQIIDLKEGFGAQVGGFDAVEVEGGFSLDAQAPTFDNESSNGDF